MKDFKYWKRCHESENLEEFSQDKIGLLWLKTKSITRKELIGEFTEANSIELKSTSLSEQFIELFNLFSKNPSKSHQLLDSYIKNKNTEMLNDIDIDQLVSELYKLKSFARSLSIDFAQNVVFI